MEGELRKPAAVQIRITGAAYQQLSKLSRELAVSKRSIASQIIEQYCNREAYARAIASGVELDAHPPSI